MKVIHPKGYDPSTFDKEYPWFNALYLVGTLAFVGYLILNGHGSGSSCSDEDEW
jgi:hypothetical protein